MGDGLTIRGRGVTLRGILGPDEFGFLIKGNGLQGWEGLPAGRRQAIVRSLSHGEHDVPVRLPARTITVDGHVVARSAYDLNRMCHQIQGWGATGDRFPLTVELQGEVLTASVRSILRDATDTGDRDGSFYTAPFQVQFVASDPRKYAEPVAYTVASGGGSVRVPSRGNFPANPVIEIPSAPSSYTVSSPAGTFTVNGATAGGTHRIDMRTGRVTRDGAWMPNVGSGRLWAIPDGAQWEHFLSAPGRVIVRDTYV